MNYTSLLAWVGCPIDAYQQAKWFGDDLELKAGYAAGGLHRSGGPRTVHADPHFGERRPLHRTREAGRGADRNRWEGGHQSEMERHCFAAAQLAGQLGLGERVQRSIAQTFERWDGKGHRPAPEPKKS